MNIAEDSIVHHTRVVAPSLIMGGTEIAYLDGLHLPGPTSGCLIQRLIIILTNNANIIIIPIIQWMESIIPCNGGPQ